MTPTAMCIFLAMVSGLEAFAQGISSPPPDDAHDGFFTLGTQPQTSGVAGSMTGAAHGLVNFEGLLARSDGDTLSIELPDERVMRFQLNPKTGYTPDGNTGRLAAFRIADVVSVQAEVKARGYFVARSVRFVRRPSMEEQAETLQCPEVTYREEENIIGGAAVDPEHDNRKLSLVAKPGAIAVNAGATGAAGAEGNDLI